MIDTSGHPALLQFANEVLGVNFIPEECRWIGSVTDDMQIMGVVVYSRWTKHNCEMSVASVTPRFMTRAFLRAVFGYPFNELGFARVTAVVEEENVKALNMNHGLGFKDEGILRNWYGEGRNGVVMGMLKDECKWLK